MSIFKQFFAKPISAELLITSTNGFHLRPIAQFVALAKEYPCEIKAKFKNNIVDAKNVTTLLSLSLENNHKFTLIAKGQDAEKAIDELVLLFRQLMLKEREVKAIKASTTNTYESSYLDAKIISKGIAIAPIHTYSKKEIQKENSLSFDEAIHRSINALEGYFTNSDDVKSNIYLAQKELLLSLYRKSKNIRELQNLIEFESEKLIDTKLSSKIDDYKDILGLVKKYLGLETKLIFPNNNFILLAKNLLPSEIDQLIDTKVAGVILTKTSINSHTSILLRASGITSVIAKVNQINNKDIILDANASVIILKPNSHDIQKAETNIEIDRKLKELSEQKRFEIVERKDGTRIKIFANIADTNSAKIAKKQGAEGVGLLRSEFLFTQVKPSLETQVKAYGDIFDIFDDITVRTIDIGGDKELPYIKLPSEDNPFLGIRGIRLFETHPDILEEQLQAIFLASKNRAIKIMFPMVSNVKEFTRVKSFAISTAKKYNINISNIKFGIMIEVPSVLFLIEEFNKVVDFYSIGTNDLTQYLFAIERTHNSLKVDELSPVVFSAIEMIIKNASKPVSICGELAGNRDAIPKLLKLGIETLSVSPKLIAETKEEIRNV